MILILDIFNEIIKKLKLLKERKDIEKYFIQLSQTNTIQVVIVTENNINKDDLSKFDIKFTKLKPSELEEDEYFLDLFQEKDELIYYKNSRRKLTNLLNAESDYISKTPIIGYYSYKGGMGRSTHLAITATHLARKYNKKIIILDCDFEAPGFSNFFLENPAAPRYQNGLIEYFFDVEVDDEINLDNYSWEVSQSFSKDGEIRIFPAGNLNIENVDNLIFENHLTHYLEGLSRLDFSSKDNIINKFKTLIEKIENTYKPDAIFIDSRTGFTDMFGIVGLKLASHVVGFFSNSVQNLPGIYQFIDSIKSIPEKRSEFRALIVNSFSDIDFFEDEFKDKVNDYINVTSDDELDDSLFTPDLFFFNYDVAIAEIGTSREKRRNWIDSLDNNRFNRGYGDVSDRLNDLMKEYRKDTNTPETVIKSYQVNNKSVEVTELSYSPHEEIQKEILSALDNNWPNLYGDSDSLNFDIELESGKFFYRDSMKDLFNFDKFLILGNKGTGKSYLFQALKNKTIVAELQKIAQKPALKIQFLHLVDKKTKYFINTDGFESFSNEIDSIGDFYAKFWKVYSWKAIVTKIAELNITFESRISSNFSIENDTANIKKIVNFISKIDNVIDVEEELKELDKTLNSKEINLIVIYDNLDLMVQPLKWVDQIAPLINFWNYSNYKRIHSKLFLRSDLFKKIRGLNNSQELINKSISIEWTKEEIFNYFFNLVKLYAKENFILATNKFDFKSISNDDIGWIGKFTKNFQNEKQSNQEEYILRRLCWVFFGQYPDFKAHGDSYDWLYKNVMNADETISLRPFIDLLKLSIEGYKLDRNNSDFTPILPSKYYTEKSVRRKAVDNHFNDLIKEKGNENLEIIFDYIDNNHQYRYYESLQKDFYELLLDVKNAYALNESIKELEELLIINGIIRKRPVGGNTKYSFAFLYKYRLGLGNRRKSKKRY
ncbi:hypothetical protein ABXT06_03315 [Flavobacterium sp. UW10123]|uniref:KGGVGR-motif variant AAA ATPase n=1 Tax=Flavobacterium sp. UW10123 TaxID=3230800 RepID=UPI003394409B